MVKISIGLLTVCLVAVSRAVEEEEEFMCEFMGALKGRILLHHKNNGKDTHFMGTVENLEPGKHGFHVHEFGKLTNQCKDAGGHYNPMNKQHGSLTSDNRHIGDLENIEAMADRMAKVDIMLMNTDMDDLLGKSIVVHAQVDDLGLTAAADSLTTGNAGARVDCCVIKEGARSSATKELSGLLLSMAASLLPFLF